MTRVALLEGPIAHTLVELAWPVLAVLALQTFVGVAETYFVSSLGTGVIAAVALVFPFFMLMTMMSNGGIGGGVSSAVARALGAGAAQTPKRSCCTQWSSSWYWRGVHGRRVGRRADALPIHRRARRDAHQCAAEFQCSLRGGDPRLDREPSGVRAPRNQPATDETLEIGDLMADGRGGHV